MTHPNSPCPITLFEHPDEDRSDRFVKATFLEFVGFISDVAGEQFDTEAGAWLFAPCEFRDDIRRSDQVVRSGLVMLEVRRGLTLDEASELLADNNLAGFIYTAASDNIGRSAFRIGIPLIEPVDSNTYTRTWQAMNRLFDSAGDWTRAGAHTPFRVPACIGGRDARVVVSSGDIRSAEEWIEELGRPEHQHVGSA